MLGDIEGQPWDSVREVKERIAIVEYMRDILLRGDGELVFFTDAKEAALYIWYKFTSGPHQGAQLGCWAKPDFMSDALVELLGLLQDVNAGRVVPGHPHEVGLRN